MVLRPGAARDQLTRHSQPGLPLGCVICVYLLPTGFCQCLGFVKDGSRCTHCADQEKQCPLRSPHLWDTGSFSCSPSPPTRCPAVLGQPARSLVELPVSEDSLGLLLKTDPSPGTLWLRHAPIGCERRMELGLHSGGLLSCEPAAAGYLRAGGEGRTGLSPGRSWWPPASLELLGFVLPSPHLCTPFTDLTSLCVSPPHQTPCLLQRGNSLDLRPRVTFRVKTQ